MGLEKLRIVSMLMIILLHSIDHSGLLGKINPPTFIYWYEWSLYALLQVCVNCFVLISGYFLVTSKFRVEKLITLWIEVVFYSITIKAIMMAAGEIPFSVISLASCFIPVISGRYWFVTIYFGLYLLFPFLNIALRAMTQKQHKTLVVLLFVLSSVMISIHPKFMGMNTGGGWGLAWFVFLYITAAYIRLYSRTNKNSVIPILIFIICPTIMTIARAMALKLGSSVLNVADNWWRYDSVPVYIASVALFLAFLHIPGKQNKLIIKLSSATFGVYLIHAHANLCTEIMWQRIGFLSYMGKWWFPIYQIMIAILIFLICSIIDMLRSYFINTTVFKKMTTDLAGLLKNTYSYIEGFPHKGRKN